MKKIDCLLLVQPLFHREKRRRPPIQLMHMATMANQIMPTKVIDGQTLGFSIKKISDFILSYKPTIVGISILSPTFPVSIKLAKEIKKKSPNTIIIAGGKHAIIDTKSVINTGIFDFVIRGEGENALIKIISNYQKSKGNIEFLKEALSNELGITFLGDTRRLTVTSDVDLKKLPIIDWNILVPKIDNYKNNIATVEDQRGCAHNCSYCTASKFHKRITFSETKLITSEILNLYRYGFDSYFLTGDDSFVNPDFAFNMLKAIAKLKLPIKLILSVRADSFMNCFNKYQNKFLEVLIKSNVSSLHIGVESGDPDILSKCNKQLNMSDVTETVRIAKLLNIIIETNWIIGLPDDSETTINNSIKLAVNIRDHIGPHFPHLSYFLPYPGTIETERSISYGLFKLDGFDLSQLSAHDKPLIPTKYLSRQKISLLYKKFITDFYNDQYIKSINSIQLKNKALQMRNKFLNKN